MNDFIYSNKLEINVSLKKNRELLKGTIHQVLLYKSSIVKLTNPQPMNFRLSLSTLWGTSIPDKDTKRKQVAREILN